MRNLLILSALSISLHSPLLAQKLDKNDDYKAGVSALKDNLAQIAIEKFQSSLKDKSLTEKDRQALLIITAEAHLKLSQSTSALDKTSPSGKRLHTPQQDLSKKQSTC